MITEDYVSFELAKLLKEKGFDAYCTKFYNNLNQDRTFELCNAQQLERASVVSNKILDDYLPTLQVKSIGYAAPTLQMAMKWLLEVHDCFIKIDRNWKSDEKIAKYSASISPMKEFTYLYCTCEFFTYEEACESAIKYCLKNLIKNEDEEEKSDIPVPKTVDEAISTLEKILSDEDREYLLKNGAISMHNSLGRWIRNEWGLWTGSELKDVLMNLNKGLNHPDDMSNYIIEEFIKYWNNKL